MAGLVFDDVFGFWRKSGVVAQRVAQQDVGV
jgi:hypothetical protein